jgi:hypothetical protein
MPWWGDLWMWARGGWSAVLSAIIPNKMPVPVCLSPQDAKPYVLEVASHYKPDLWGGVLDETYEGRIIEFYRAKNSLDLLPSCDCDDVAYYAWSLLYGQVDDPAVVVILDSGPKGLHHCVFACRWQGADWTLDVNGLHVRDGISVADLFSHIYPEAHYTQEVWSRSYPFPDPRKA